MDFDLSKYQIYFVVCGEKGGFWDKNSDLCCDDKKKEKKRRFLMTEKLDMFLLLKKNEKDFFKKRVSLTIWIYAVMN